MENGFLPEIEDDFVLDFDSLGSNSSMVGLRDLYSESENWETIGSSDVASLAARSGVTSTGSGEENSASIDSSHDSETQDTTASSKMRKMQRAKSCREYRAKRRLKKETLQARNQELEAEQKQFLREIAKLQNEIEGLKNHTVEPFSMKTENRILRSELKRHKTLVSHLKSLLTNFPDHALSSEDKYDIVNSAMESGAGQLLGWCRTSVMDPTNWRVVEINHGLKDECFKNLKVVCRYQLLPFAAKVESATRIISRLDFYNMPEGFVKFLEQLDHADGKEMKQFCEEINEKHSMRLDLCDKEINNLFGNLCLDDIREANTNVCDTYKNKFDSLRMYRVESGPLIEIPFTTSVLQMSCLKSVSSFAFPRVDDAMGFFVPHNITSQDRRPFSVSGSDLIEIHATVSIMIPSQLVNEFHENETTYVSNDRVEGFLAVISPDPSFPNMVHVTSTELNEEERKMVDTPYGRVHTFPLTSQLDVFKSLLEMANKQGYFDAQAS
uniref:BZIP domain-containing protein n=1 Tax=Aplanochytrium stocchinoi TaxID=215587 RepID=A0A6S8C8J6_9STRA|mmetsp:Transcript_1047/g.1543  ORF Transcript_1047/g.1543 Transcript_1047/m.1543 type:complete len:497 (+) Transcript_1047:183-1673(+)|eukprot:CAMPEP_0204843622 /NCGR_PEP_ID=MMETSP1346-20131115/48085_1 /ASSEMBLY_ACC=CAM_ASM_000771 /TAXON_ID=215587 /ORGANISM="Aplanochytrium stocchinoi, Strain GSBS06" /LENGTH=496 /DNA_ID=CAMNT_0051982791 /DNA_START=95 /DNA_END=1585 /DNA_ORIENTATION=-